MPVTYPNLKGHKIILASKSPRRQELMKGLGIPFEVRTKDVNEDFSEDLTAEEIPLFLAQLKASAFKEDLSNKEILVTSDTVVWLGDRVFNKPQKRKEAIEMITELEGRSHQVITAICLTSQSHQVLVSETTKVKFGNVDHQAIEWYVDQYKPFDKAGAYGIQEWIGYVGIEKIEGSFYNVMGFPTRLFYTELFKFIDL
ncbi:MAG: Maf family nucleotide pyrophosphatase [Flavobacteriales bacterium]|nr:Maf family nucleotide pyrophosphatase [Flavobacteriales bacterium]